MILYQHRCLRTLSLSSPLNPTSLSLSSLFLYYSHSDSPSLLLAPFPLLSSFPVLPTPSSLGSALAGPPHSLSLLPSPSHRVSLPFFSVVDLAYAESQAGPALKKGVPKKALPHPSASLAPSQSFRRGSRMCVSSSCRDPAPCPGLRFSWELGSFFFFSREKKKSLVAI